MLVNIFFFFRSWGLTVCGCYAPVEEYLVHLTVPSEYILENCCGLKRPKVSAPSETHADIERPMNLQTIQGPQTVTKLPLQNHSLLTGYFVCLFCENNVPV